MLVNESQIRALIRLLADEDEKIVQTISSKLIDIGPTAVPLLQEAEIERRIHRQHKLLAYLATGPAGRVRRYPCGPCGGQQGQERLPLRARDRVCLP